MFEPDESVVQTDVMERTHMSSATPSSVAPVTLEARDALRSTLESIYGDESSEQLGRYADALGRFRDRFGPGPVTLFRAPGRINLIGGHTDYNRGYVMPVALNRDLVLLARPRSDGRVQLANIEAEFPEDTFRISRSIPQAESAPWTNYVRGAAQMVANISPIVQGMDCLVVGQAPFGIPRGSGLSSSSALTVAAVLALGHFAQLDVERESFVQLCSDAEWYVGTRGGIMDQYVSLFANRNHALFLDCRPNGQGSYQTRLVPLSEAHEIIIAESGVRHNNVRGEYNKRVASCRVGVALLRSTWPHATHLRDLEDVAWEQIEPLLPSELSVAEALSLDGCDIDDVPGLMPHDILHVLACCRHVWHENHRVLEAYSALHAGDVVTAGHLISQAHASARDNYDISFPEMETLVSTASSAPGVVGGRITGAGWGGCAVFLVERDAAPALTARLESEFERRHGARPSVFPCRSGTAAGYAGDVVV